MMPTLTPVPIASSVFMPQSSNDPLSASSVIPWHENSPPPPPDDIPEDNEILEEINTPDFLHEEPIFMTNNPAPAPFLDHQDFSISSLNLRSITPIKTEDYKIDNMQEDQNGSVILAQENGTVFISDEHVLKM